MDVEASNVHGSHMMPFCTISNESSASDVLEFVPVATKYNWNTSAIHSVYNKYVYESVVVVYVLCVHRMESVLLPSGHCDSPRRHGTHVCMASICPRDQ